MAQNVTVKFGGQAVTTEASTVLDILTNERLRDFLGFGNNVEARTNGSIVSDNFVLSDGQVVTLENKAQTKG